MREKKETSRQVHSLVQVKENFTIFSTTDKRKQKRLGKTIIFSSHYVLCLQCHTHTLDKSRRKSLVSKSESGEIVSESGESTSKTEKYPKKVFV